VDTANENRWIQPAKIGEYDPREGFGVRQHVDSSEKSVKTGGYSLQIQVKTGGYSQRK
jgi:hypothetical protein